MDIILAKIILKEENKTITKKDLINEKYDCDIIINGMRFSNSMMTLEKENNIIYIFKKKYTQLSELFSDCKLLTSIIYLILILIM